MENNFNWITGEFEPVFKPYHGLFQDIKDKQKILNSEANKYKVKIHERITGKSFTDSSVFPYLEYNAQTLRDYDLQGKISVISQCQKTAINMSGVETGNKYLKTIHCRKQWCPVCGGKGGTVHKSRLHSILKRVDVNKYNMRQFVLTLPSSVRDQMNTRENLNLFYSYSKLFIEKFYGEPQFDKLGHIMRYKLKKGAIGYLHLFGDDENGILKPHVNIHILESLDEKLKIDTAVLETMKKWWLKKLKNFDESLTVVDIHYKFRIDIKHKMHALKYMTKPYSDKDFKAVEDENIKKLLVEDLSGFQFLRFWGALSNCKYQDDMDTSDIQTECESIIKEKLIFHFIQPFNYESWKNRLIEIESGFYQLKEKGRLYEPAEIQKKEVCQ
jgi:hypothetical protein